MTLTPLIGKKPPSGLLSLARSQFSIDYGQDLVWAKGIEFSFDQAKYLLTGTYGPGKISDVFRSILTEGAIHFSRQGATTNITSKDIIRTYGKSYEFDF